MKVIVLENHYQISYFNKNISINNYQRQQEQKILQEIAFITSTEFAEQAAEILDNHKHMYSFEHYLTLLADLQKLVIAGIPNCIAINGVQTGYDADKIITFYKQGFINTVELAIDCNLPLSAADYMTYKQLIKEDHDASKERKTDGRTN